MFLHLSIALINWTNQWVSLVYSDMYIIYISNFLSGRVEIVGTELFPTHTLQPRL